MLRDTLPFSAPSREKENGERNRACAMHRKDDVEVDTIIENGYVIDPKLCFLAMLFAVRLLIFYKSESFLEKIIEVSLIFDYFTIVFPQKTHGLFLSF